MAGQTDLTFFTNEEGRTLSHRFGDLIKNTAFFDVLVGYFYVSGFHLIHKPLQKTEKIRILVGIGIGKQAYRTIKEARQQVLQLSHKEIGDVYAEELKEEMVRSEDTKDVEDGAKAFLNWLQSKKLEIKAYQSADIHAKLYIMSFHEGLPDKGRVITGSSNFTRAGLQENLEFNVELKTVSDYKFAKQKFEELWRDAVDLSEKCVHTIQQETWLREITPYELYLKFLYSYFEEGLKDVEGTDTEIPFMNLEYQRRAVLSAKRVLEAYGGVFLSDVVGLGKTYMAAMLAQQLEGKHLVIVPPKLLDEGKTNPGSWQNVFYDLDVSANFRSWGKLDDIIKHPPKAYDNVFIDEAHAFRSEETDTYNKLTQICRGKRVVLVTATPFNNRLADILSPIKLFQNARQSAIPNIPDLVAFFAELAKRITGLDKQKDRNKYTQIGKENAQRIREDVLKYLMVRRTRGEIKKYFADDLSKQGITFPEVEAPKPVFYQLNEAENKAFDETADLITRKLSYARYTPMLYHEKRAGEHKQGQKNLKGLMKTLLVKRLESSFYAFIKTLERFISLHDGFIKALDRGQVYSSEKHIKKIFEHMDDDNDEAIQKLLNEDKATSYPAEDFNDQLKIAIESDLEMLKKMQATWKGMSRDPKLDTFVELLSKDPQLKESKVIVFTESQETATYLKEKLARRFHEEVLLFTGSSGKKARDSVAENFDANSKEHKNDYRILIATEVLSEGVNLHRSNVVINYDLPWNPTRLMQRVGRINRIGTQFKKLYVFNFFPTQQSNDEIKLEETAKAKISQFITLLGTDAKHLTDDESIEAHELFDMIISKRSVSEEEQEESELKYEQVIRDIREKDPELFKKISRLPQKARVAKKHAVAENQLLTYFRKGKLKKFFLVSDGDSEEVNFIRAAQLLDAQKEEPRKAMPIDFWAKLQTNDSAFRKQTPEKKEVSSGNKGTGNEQKLLKQLKAMQQHPDSQYTKEETDYIQRVMQRLRAGVLPKNAIRKAYTALEDGQKTGVLDLQKKYELLRKHIPERLLEDHAHERTDAKEGLREVILSMYLIK